MAAPRRAGIGITASVLLLSLAGQGWAANPDKAGAQPPKPRSYLDLPLGPTDQPARLPYVWERRIGGKHVVILGTRHARDPASPMYARIEDIFERVRPQLVIHESQVPRQITALTRSEAIRLGADAGFIVHLAAANKVPVRSGSHAVRNEIAALLKRHSAEEVLVYLTAQRHIGYARRPDLAKAEAGYAAFHEDYLVANGFPDRDRWDDWQGFLSSWQRVTGSALTPQAWDRDLWSPIRDRGRLSEMGRISSSYTDGRLVATIRQALVEHDRVLVTFGSWHVLSLEPVLEHELFSTRSAR